MKITSILIFLTCIFTSIFTGIFTWVSSANARNVNNVVKVCNKGNVLLQYTVLATHKSRFNDTARIAGFYDIKPNQCDNINLHTYDAMAVAFFYRDAIGNFGNPTYHIKQANLRPLGSARWAPKTLCINNKIATEASGKTDFILKNYSGLCALDKRHRANVSFAIMPNDIFVTYNISPNKNHLFKKPWPYKKIPANLYLKNKCNQNQMSSCQKLAQSYDRGTYEKINKSLALTYYKKACNSGQVPDACTAIYYIEIAQSRAKKKSENKRKRAQQKAKRKADKKARTAAQLKKTHDYLYRNMPDEKASLVSCSQKKAKACSNLGTMYFYGRYNGVKKDYGKSYIYHQKACDIGSKRSCSDAKNAKNMQKFYQQMNKFHNANSK